MAERECSGMFSCDQNNFLHNSELLLSLLLGVFVSVLLLYGRKWFAKKFFTSKTENTCPSSSCVRCHKNSEVENNAITCFKKLEKISYIYVTARIRSAITEGEMCRDLRQKCQNPNTLFVPGLSDEAWFDGTEYCVNDVKVLKDNYASIEDEFHEVFAGHSELWSKNSVPSGGWSIFCLINQGCWIEKNCFLCPKTCKVIRELKSVMEECVFGNAAFSVLEPQTEIEEHCGPTNARIRCHLGLQVPEGACLTVNSISKSWNERDCLLFDDSFLHSASNKSKKYQRVIFMVDLWHPSLTRAEQTVIKICYGTESEE